MPKNPDAITLARTLAAQFANEAPWTQRGEFDSDDAISQVSDALRPTFDQEQKALLAELEPVLDRDLFVRVSDFFGTTLAHAEDGGYLFGLAVGQLIRIPALSPQENGGAR